MWIDWESSFFYQLNSPSNAICSSWSCCCLAYEPKDKQRFMSEKYKGQYSNMWVICLCLEEGAFKFHSSSSARTFREDKIPLPSPKHILNQRVQESMNSFWNALIGSEHSTPGEAKIRLLSSSRTQPTVFTLFHVGPHPLEEEEEEEGRGGTLCLGP